MKARRTIFGAASVVAVMLVLSRLTGYIREALMADRFGATHVTDAFLVAQEIPSALFSAIGTALVMVFVPVYRSVIQNQGEEPGRRLATNVLNATLLLSAVLTAAAWLLAPEIVPRLVPGLPTAVLELTVSLTRTMLPIMLLLGLGGVFTAVLNANHRFAAPAAVGLISNLVVVGTLLVVTAPEQIRALALAVVAGALLGALVQVPPLGRLVSVAPQLNFRDPGLKQIGRLILPVALTATAIQMQVFVDRFLASNMAAGSISALTYAIRISALPYGVIGAAISTVIYPRLAESAVGGDEGEVGAATGSGLRTLSYVLMPMALGLIVFRAPLVQLFFQRGAFDPRATAMTAYVLGYYGVGILFFGWLDFLNRCFFVLQDTLTPMWISILMVVLNIGFNLLLVGPMGLAGLALGTSLATAVAVGLLLWQLRRRLNSFRPVPLIRSASLHTLCALVGAAVGFGVYRLVATFVPGIRLSAQVVRVGSALLAVVVVHVLLAGLLGDREGVDIAARLTPKLRRGRS